MRCIVERYSGSSRTRCAKSGESTKSLIHRQNHLKRDLTRGRLQPKN